VPADIWKVDLRFFYPVFDDILSNYPTVIAFNFLTMDTPTADELYQDKL